MLNKPALVDGLIQLQTKMEDKDEDAKQYYATQFANLIEAFVKSGKVQPGIAVSTAGSASAQTGVTTAEGSIL